MTILCSGPSIDQLDRAGAACHMPGQFLRLRSFGFFYKCDKPRELESWRFAMLEY
jgi:hypothetical protein